MDAQMRLEVSSLNELPVALYEGAHHWLGPLLFRLCKAVVQTVQAQVLLQVVLGFRVRAWLLVVG